MSEHTLFEILPMPDGEPAQDASADPGAPYGYFPDGRPRKRRPRGSGGTKTRRAASKVKKASADLVDAVRQGWRFLGEGAVGFLAFTSSAQARKAADAGDPVKAEALERQSFAHMAAVARMRVHGPAIVPALADVLAQSEKFSAASKKLAEANPLIALLIVTIPLGQDLVRVYRDPEYASMVVAAAAESLEEE